MISSSMFRFYPAGPVARKPGAYLVYSLRQIETVFDLLLVSLTYFGILIPGASPQAAVLPRHFIGVVRRRRRSALRLPTFTWVLTGGGSGLDRHAADFPAGGAAAERLLGCTLGFADTRPPNWCRVAGAVACHQQPQPAAARRRADRAGGTTELNDVIGTGVTMQAGPSADLLETIFQDKHPCMTARWWSVKIELPRLLLYIAAARASAARRYAPGDAIARASGSAKRPTVWLLSFPETGAISVAENGLLHRNLDATELREYLYRFYDPSRPVPAA